MDENLHLESNLCLHLQTCLIQREALSSSCAVYVFFLTFPAAFYPANVSA